MVWETRVCFIEHGEEASKEREFEKKTERVHASKNKPDYEVGFLSRILMEFVYPRS